MRMSRADNGVLLECKNSGSISPAHDWPVSREPESAEASAWAGTMWYQDPKTGMMKPLIRLASSWAVKVTCIASADSGSRLTAGWEP